MPQLFIIAGCNGAGKTTASFTLLPEVLGIQEYVNADEIARGLSPFRPESVAVEAGRIMLSRIKELMNSNTDFAFETTLAAKSYVSLITEAKSMGYEIHLIFLWLESAEEAIQRVEDRVASGGHSIPTDVIRRRYTRGLVNFFKVYSKITDEWMFVNNSGGSPVLIANRRKRNSNIFFHELWHSIQRSIEHE
jgi:predicted ABC-type ATPase